VSDLIADSCVVAKWFLPEPDSDAALRVLTHMQAAGGQVIVLDLAFPEVANVVWKHARRGLIDVADAERLLELLLRTSVRIEPARPFLQSAFKIAAKYDRAVNDALVVTAAVQLGVAAVTADERLYNAIRDDFTNVKLLSEWDVPGGNKSPKADPSK
jgi:predicted nucleic acid-binding protein